MIDVARIVSSGLRPRLQKTPMPPWVPPAKATLTHDFFWSADWSYERKLDGIRALATKDKTVTLYSRNQIILNNTYPEIVEALMGIEGVWWLDGEIVTFNGENTSFKKLQKRMQIKDPNEARNSGVEVFLYLFDCMYLNGYDIRGLSYSERRRILHMLVRPKDPLRLLLQEQPSEKAFQQICQKGWEGLIVKDLSSVYDQSGHGHG